MGLFEDIKLGKYNLEIFIIIGILFFNLYWNKTTETMADVGPLTEDRVKQLIYETYLIDVNAIKNLSDVATQLQAGGLTVPGNLTVKGNLLTEGELTAQLGNFRLGNIEKDQWMFHAPSDDRGGLWIARVVRNGDPNWANGLNLLTSADGTLNTGGNFNLTPRGTIVVWSGATAPAGWALCNGENGTPDLRGKFILSWDPRGGKHGKVPGNNYSELWGSGGDQVHQLSVGELAAHAHGFGANVNAYRKFDTADGNEPGDFGGEAYVSTGAAGGNEVHNNMPPYFVLAYIMKL